MIREVKEQLTSLLYDFPRAHDYRVKIALRKKKKKWPSVRITTHSNRRTRQDIKWRAKGY